MNNMKPFKKENKERHPLPDESKPGSGSQLIMVFIFTPNQLICFLSKMKLELLAST